MACSGHSGREWGMVTQILAFSLQNLHSSCHTRAPSLDCTAHTTSQTAPKWKGLPGRCHGSLKAPVSSKGSTVSGFSYSVLCLPYAGHPTTTSLSGKEEQSGTSLMKTDALFAVCQVRSLDCARLGSGLNSEDPLVPSTPARCFRETPGRCIFNNHPEQLCPVSTESHCLNSVKVSLSISPFYPKDLPTRMEVDDTKVVNPT